MRISENLYIFLKIDWRLKMKMEVLEEGEAEKTKRFTRGAREIEKFLKTVWDFTLFVQNTCFSRLIWLTSKLPKWIAKIPCARFWTISLSLFRNWDFHLLVSHEPLWVTSQLDFHSWSSRKNESWKWKNLRIFEKFSKYFSWLEVSLA